MAKERLQKLLASNGHGSRRQIEKFIEEGRITVNGVVAKLGQLSDNNDQVELDEIKLKLKDLSRANSRVLILNKPSGVICTKNDPKGRPTVYENLPKLYKGRWIGVGRLDINTTGLYIFTNDGNLASLLIQPRLMLKRVYLVKVSGLLTTKQLEKLRNGVTIEKEEYKVDSILLHKQLTNNTWYKISISRGRNHEIKKLIMSQGFVVVKLLRISYGDLTLPKDLKQGNMQELSNCEALSFKDDLENLTKLQ